ncbi:terminase large subunit domain-containing protein [Streptomyces sp. NPDC058239]|uniref:terminase large subunit domain-containing protein n=1 Tax=unclassified Streptomyces TaxID=2593676 RepID=UPI00365C7E62
MRPPTSDREIALLDRYRSLSAGQRHPIAAQAKPSLLAKLLRVEQQIAMDRSPGALAAVLTDRREMQARHLNLVDTAWIDMAEGRRDRVVLSMPPRHGKSRRASRWGPLWSLRKYPHPRVIIGSYSSDLADEHGAWIRDAIQTWGDDLGIHLNPGSKARNRFNLHGHEGGLTAAGIGGGLTGKGASIAIVDDPVKDMADADSPTMRKRVWDWWQAVLQTRLEPDGAICVIQTRWHEDDLSGRILAEAEANEWHVIELPAIADSPDDILGRKIGEPLWPERFDAVHHAKTRRRVDESSPPCTSSSPGRRRAESGPCLDRHQPHLCRRVRRPRHGPHRRRRDAAVPIGLR